MLMMKNDPSTNAPIKVWVRRLIVDGLKTTDQKSATSARPKVGLMWYPAGVCCQLLATMIQIDEKIDPRSSMMDARKWIRDVTRFHPKARTARKPDSRKKAKMPSAATADPNTSPTSRE